jgi:anti-anti-sigma regulatory factor
MLREGKVYVRDLGSTNGTYLNEERVRGELELHHGDALRIGPLDFDVEFEVTPGVEKVTPMPPTKAPAKAKETDAAAILLSLPDARGNAGAGGSSPDPDDVPGGRTEMDLQVRHAVEFEEIGDVIAVHFTQRTILEDDTIRIIGDQLLGLVEESNQHKVLLDLRSVRAMSTAMIQKIVNFNHKIQAAGGRLVLCNVHSLVAPAFQQFRPARALVIRKDEQQGLEELG